MTEGSSNAPAAPPSRLSTLAALQTALFYNLDVKRDATASVTLGALQDNGIVTTRAPAAFPTWKMGAGGDGFAVAHDWQNATEVYGRSNATIVSSTDDGTRYGNITPPFSAAEGRNVPCSRRDRSKHRRQRVREQQLNLWQSTDGGATWPNKVAIPGNRQ